MVARSHCQPLSHRKPAVFIDQWLCARISHIILVPGFFFLGTVAFAVGTVEWQLRIFQFGQQIEFFGNFMECPYRRINGDQPAVHLALQNDFGDFANWHFGCQRRAHSVFD